MKRETAINAAVIAMTIALGGMAYCHVKDVGMKLEEHVYYMAGLFGANIVASLLLIPTFVFARVKRSGRLLTAAWAAAGSLAALTIVGFVYSRTAGFPQMEDHVGEWDTLGLTSLVFEGAIVILSASMLVRIRPLAKKHAAASFSVLVVAGVLGLALVAPVALSDEMGMGEGQGMGLMWGDMSMYPKVENATVKQRDKATRLWRAVKRNATRFRSAKTAQRLGYRFNRTEVAMTGVPGVFHARKQGGRFWGRVLDPTAPQALLYWCTRSARCTLVAFMFRAPSDSKPPIYGPMLAWHRHKDRPTTPG